MSRSEKSYSLHHILPSSRWWATNDVNCEMIRETTHRAIHTLFSNKLFAEQLIRLTDINAKALRPDVVQQLLQVLEWKDPSDPFDRYKRECIK